MATSIAGLDLMRRQRRRRGIGKSSIHSFGIVRGNSTTLPRTIVYTHHRDSKWSTKQTLLSSPRTRTLYPRRRSRRGQ